MNQNQIFVKPPLRLPEGVVAEDLGEGGVALRGAGGDPFTSASWETLTIPGLKRFMALCLHHHFMTTPSFGTELSQVPGRCQFLLWEDAAGGYGALLPVLHEDFRSEACGTEGGLQIKTSCSPAGRARKDVVLAVACLRDDPYAAVQDGLRLALGWMNRGRLRTEKATPRWIDYLGWCTWDSFYTEVNEEKIIDGLKKFQEGGIVPGQMIIDEGWQDYSAKNFLLSYGVKKGAFTGGRLAAIVQRAKQDFGVKMVGCWRTLFGELRGVDPGSTALSHLKSRVVIEPDTKGDTFGVVEPADVPRFHDEYAAAIAADGVDFIKVDFQSALQLMTYEQCGRADAARIWQYGVQDSVGKHFKGEMLNCMALGSDEVYHARASNVSRASDDFYPGKDGSHPLHIRQNLYNSVWLAPIQWPDWDMFQSEHPWALYHATARAISGGPVYVSDKPGNSDYGLLKRFVAADGKVLRCPQPALPARDTLFIDPVAARRMIKAFNRCGDIGLLALFHPFTDSASEAVEEQVGAWNVEGLAEGRFAVYSLRRGFVGVVDFREALPVRLEQREADLLIFSPLVKGFAAIGLLDKFNPAAAIMKSAVGDASVRLEVRGGGRFGFYSEKPVGRVRLDGKVAGFENVGGMVTLDTGNAAVCQVEIEE